MDVDMELDRRVEALFELIGYLASYIVDASDREALFRSSGLTAHLADMATTIRRYFAANGVLTRGWRFRAAFTQSFNMDLEAWTAEVTAKALAEQAKDGGGGVPGGMALGDIPLPKFTNTKLLLPVR